MQALYAQAAGALSASFCGAVLVMALFFPPHTNVYTNVHLPFSTSAAPISQVSSSRTERASHSSICDLCDRPKGDLTSKSPVHVDESTQRSVACD